MTWENGMMVARNMRLADLLTELGRYRQGVLRCHDAVADLTVSGAFSLRDTDASVLGLGLDTGLRGVDQPDESFDWIAASPSTAYLDYAAIGIRGSSAWNSSSSAFCTRRSGVLSTSWRASRTSSRLDRRSVRASHWRPGPGTGVTRGPSKP